MRTVAIKGYCLRCGTTLLVPEYLYNLRTRTIRYCSECWFNGGEGMRGLDLQDAIKSYHLRPGDFVECTNSFSDHFTYENEYELFRSEDGCLGVYDDYGQFEQETLSYFLPTEIQATDKEFEDDDILYEAGKHFETGGVVREPHHYTRFTIEPVTFIMKNGLDFETGNIVKYACRAGHKLYEGMDETQSAITDLEKVRRYAEMKINLLKGEDVL